VKPVGKRAVVDAPAAADAGTASKAMAVQVAMAVDLIFIFICISPMQTIRP
jgi:hypothetical protein